MIGNLISRINDAEKLSQPQLAKTVADGIIPKGIADLVASDKANMSRMMQPTPQVPTGTVADSVMQSAEQSADPLSIIDHKIEVLTKDNLRLHNEIANGEIKPYIGIPKLAEQVKELNSLKSFKLQLEQAQNPQPQAEMPQAQVIPSVQNVAQDQQPAGVENLSSNLPQSYADGGILNFQPIDTYDTEHEYAGGGMVAFAGGGDIEDYLDQDNEDDWARISSTNATNEADLIDMIANSGGRPVYRPTGSKGLESLKGEHAKYSGKTEAHPFGEQVMEAAKKYGLDPNFALKLANIETGNLKNPEKAVSPAGAMGVMQLMPSTAKGLGVKDPFNPEENISGGVRLAKRLVDKYNGDYKLAAAAYNWGEGNVDKMLKAGRGFESAPKETQKYVASLAEGGITSLANGGPTGSDYDLERLSDSQAESDKLNDNDYMRRVKAIKNLPSSIANNLSLKGIASLANSLTPVGSINDAVESGKNLGKKFIDWSKTPVGEQRKIWEAGKEARENFGSKNQPKPWAGPSGSDLSTFYNQDVANASPAANATSEKINTPEGLSNNKSENDIVNAEKVSNGEVQATPSYLTMLQQRLIDDMAEAREQGNMNKYLALMQAGLSMMGGTSPYAMTNIGQGAASGVSAFANLQKATNEDLRKLRSQEIGLANIQEKALAHKAAVERQNNLARERLGLTKEHYQSQEQLDRDKLNSLNAQRAQENVNTLEKVLGSQWEKNPLNLGKSDAERNAFIYGHPAMKKAMEKAGIDMSELTSPKTTAIPKVGDVIGGFKFKGGNPNDKSNWEKV